MAAPAILVPAARMSPIFSPLLCCFEYFWKAAYRTCWLPLPNKQYTRLVIVLKKANSESLKMSLNNSDITCLALCNTTARGFVALINSPSFWTLAAPSKYRTSVYLGNFNSIFFNIKTEQWRYASGILYTTILYIFGTINNLQHTAT
jgi:hypothetical protein